MPAEQLDFAGQDATAHEIQSSSKQRLAIAEAASCGHLRGTADQVGQGRGLATVDRTHCGCAGDGYLSCQSALGTLVSFHSVRAYKNAIDKFIVWYCSEPRLGFN